MDCLAKLYFMHSHIVGFMLCWIYNQFILPNHKFCPWMQDLICYIQKYCVEPCGGTAAFLLSSEPFWYTASALSPLMFDWICRVTNASWPANLKTIRLRCLRSCRLEKPNFWANMVDICWEALLESICLEFEEYCNFLKGFPLLHLHHWFSKPIKLIQLASLCSV